MQAGGDRITGVFFPLSPGKAAPTAPEPKALRAPKEIPRILEPSTKLQAGKRSHTPNTLCLSPSLRLPSPRRAEITRRIPHRAEQRPLIRGTMIATRAACTATRPAAASGALSLPSPLLRAPVALGGRSRVCGPWNPSLEPTPPHQNNPYCPRPSPGPPTPAPAGTPPPPTHTHTPHSHTCR